QRQGPRVSGGGPRRHDDQARPPRGRPSRRRRARPLRHTDPRVRPARAHRARGGGTPPRARGARTDRLRRGDAGPRPPGRPGVLTLDVRASYGLREARLRGREQEGGDPAPGIARYEAWKVRTESAVGAARTRTLAPFGPSEPLAPPPPGPPPLIVDIHLPRAP